MRDDMNVIIDEIISNVRAVEKELALSQEAMRRIVAACMEAVQDKAAKDQRMREEQSVDGPWGAQSQSDRREV
jgi:hypothetical protein